VRELAPIPWIDKVIAASLALAVVGGVIAAVVFAARRGGGQSVGQPAPAYPETTVFGVGGGEASSGGAFVVHWWVFAGVAIVLVAGVVLLLRGRRRAAVAGRPAGRSGRRARLQTAIEDSLEAIAGEADPRRAVIRAYVRMEQMFAEHGLGRSPHEAPAEYLSRALMGIDLGRAAAERLTDIFVRARFSHHVVDAGLKDDAIAALTAVRDELQAAAS
jgi:hypothetical protein